MIDPKLDLKVAKMHKLTQESRIKAFIDLSVNDALVIKGLRIVNGKNGLFISMPQEKGKDNRWYNSVQCLSDDVQNHISEVVMKAYQESMS